jgi:hypothetical protein
LGITGDRGGDGGAAFKRIAMSTGKGGKTERWAKPNGIESNAYGIEKDAEKANPYLCSVFASQATPAPATKPPAPALPDDGTFVEQTVRIRDCDQTSDRYDLTSGDFIPTRPPAPRRHQQAVTEVLMGLATRSTRLDRHTH